MLKVIVSGMFTIFAAILKPMVSSILVSWGTRSSQTHDREESELPNRNEDSIECGVSGSFSRLARETNITRTDSLFVGREADSAKLVEHIINEKRRVVSILGTGGLGKTRLAREVAIELIDSFAGGVWFVDLIEASTEIGVVKAIHDTFELNQSSNQIESAESIVELLNDKKPLLLILDNFEQVAEHAKNTVSYWAARLPNVSFLVTSRVPLKLVGETRFYLEPLDLLPTSETDADRIVNNSSVKLFSERATLLSPDFSVSESNATFINQICNQLQGIPLAIELAAGRSQLLSPKEIFETLNNQLTLGDRTKDRDQKHGTLKAAIEWSFDLLTEEEKESLLQMSVFKDGFTLDAAKKIVKIGAKPSGEKILGIVQNLLDHSLLRTFRKRDLNRFEMYVAIDEFAQAKLKSIKSRRFVDKLIERWSRYYIGYVEDQKAAMSSTKSHECLNRISDELENILGIQDAYLNAKRPKEAAQAVLAIADLMSVKGPALLRVPRLRLSYESFESSDCEIVGRLAYELSKAYLAKGEWNDAEKFAEKAVEIAEPQGDSGDLARALNQQGFLFKERGYLRRSIRLFDEAIDIFEKLGNTIDIATCLNSKANALERLGEFAAALKCMDKADAIASENGDSNQVGLIQNKRSLAYWHHGDAMMALKVIANARATCIQAGNEILKPALLTNEALYLGDLDRFDEALEKFEAADVLHRDQGTRHWAAVNYGGWGRTLLMRGRNNDLEIAIELLQKAESVSRQIYYPENIALHIGDLGRAHLLDDNANLAFDKVFEAIALERRMGTTHEHRHFCNLVTLARICRKLGRTVLLWETLVRALQIQLDLGLCSEHQIRKVREDVGELRQLVHDWNVNYSIIDKSKYNGFFNDAQLKPPTFIANLKVDEQRAFELLEETHRMLNRSGYEYPWHTIDKELELKGSKKITLFGYGSLLNKVSAMTTLRPDSVQHYRPVIGFGIKRLLDYDMPDVVRQRSMYKNVEDKLSTGLFNARFTGSISDCANGAIIDVKVEDIAALREREVGYDLRPIFCVPWDNPNGEFIEAYTLSCSGRLWEGKRLSNSNLQPHEDYYFLCREGAKNISDEFLEFFLKTSYLADGKTTAKEWEFNKTTT